jgi:hypothetical protein
MARCGGATVTITSGSCSSTIGVMQGIATATAAAVFVLHGAAAASHIRNSLHELTLVTLYTHLLH